MPKINIAKRYEEGIVTGWLGLDAAREAFKLIGNEFIPFQIIGKTREISNRVMLWEVVRKVLNRDLLYPGQSFGYCVGAGARHVLEYVQCCEKLMNGEFEQFKPIFWPYHYATGRLIEGGGRIGGPDGSLGSWQFAAIKKYGAIPTDEEGLPEMTDAVGRKWAVNRSYCEKYLDKGKKHLIKSGAKINNVEELCEAIANGFSCTCASNVGFTMQVGSNGLHRRSGNWAHQMAFTGYNKQPKSGPPHIALKNSWGDAHGLLKDSDTGEEWPKGYLRISFEDADHIIKSGEETFAFSNFDGFPEQLIDKALFDLIGN